MAPTYEDAIAWHWYQISGLLLRSAIELPELDGGAGPEHREAPDLTLRLGPVPETLADCRHSTPFGSTALHQIGPDSVLFNVFDLMRCEIRDGREIVLTLADPAIAGEARVYLLGSVLSVLFHQRGLLPLHASAIDHGGGAIAFAGASGIGKSTLAAALMQRGHKILTDDVCVVAAGADGTMTAWPGVPRLRLWTQSMTALGLDGGDAVRDIFRFDKFQHKLGGAAAPAALPLRAIYCIVDDADAGMDTITRLHGRTAVTAVMGQLSRPENLKLPGRMASALGLCAELTRKVPIYCYHRHRDLARLFHSVTHLERHFHDHTPPRP